MGVLKSRRRDTNNLVKPRVWSHVSSPKNDRGAEPQQPELEPGLLTELLAHRRVHLGRHLRLLTRSVTPAQSVRFGRGRLLLRHSGRGDSRRLLVGCPYCVTEELFFVIITLFGLKHGSFAEFLNVPPSCRSRDESLLLLVLTGDKNQRDGARRHLQSRSL